jgi:hypothetical protein
MAKLWNRGLVPLEMRPNSAVFFSPKKTGPAAEGGLPPGPESAVDSACRDTALAQENYRRRTWNVQQK